MKTLNQYCKERFGCKVYKLALSADVTCPNRDGTVGSGGCIFCSEGGSGDFAADAKKPENTPGRKVPHDGSHRQPHRILREFRPHGPSALFLLHLSTWPRAASHVICKTVMVGSPSPSLPGSLFVPLPVLLLCFCVLSVS